VGLKLICHAIHFRSEQLRKMFSSNDLVGTESVSQDYRFAEALLPWSKIWLHDALPEAGVLDLVKLLEVARLLDAWEEYSRISFHIVRLQIRSSQPGEGIAADTIGASVGSKGDLA
jgi:hypothetical protein